VRLHEATVTLRDRAVRLHAATVILRDRAVRLHEATVTLRDRAAGLHAAPATLRDRAVHLHATTDGVCEVADACARQLFDDTRALITRAAPFVEPWAQRKGGTQPVSVRVRE
jgi:hypothetical protein